MWGGQKIRKVQKSGLEETCVGNMAATLHLISRLYTNQYNNSVTQTTHLSPHLSFPFSVKIPLTGEESKKNKNGSADTYEVHTITFFSNSDRQCWPSATIRGFCSEIVLLLSFCSSLASCTTEVCCSCNCSQNLHAAGLQASLYLP